MDITIAKAKIKLYKKDSGRMTPFSSGYRPVFSFENQDMKTSGEIILIDQNEFAVGDEGIVMIRFKSDFLKDSFGKEVKFTFGESSEPLGEGIIIEVLNTLKKCDK